MSPLKPEVVRHGSLMSRAIEWCLNRLEGRRLVECHSCRGLGTQSLQTFSGFNGYETVVVVCPSCHGVGEVWS